VLPLRVDLIGQCSVFATDDGAGCAGAAHREELQDVRLRVAAHANDRDAADAVAREVLALYTCGPAGGGGVRTQVTNRLASDSCDVPRGWLRPGWSFVA
jgi:hypothetical protein